MSPRPPLRHTAALLVALLLATSVGAPSTAQEAPPGLTLPADGELAADAALTPATAPDAIDPEIDLTVVRTRLEEVGTGLPASDWTIADLAIAMDFDPEQPFVFVRDRIGFQPYAGVLRGAAGTLAARAGNSWDRALLLQALLDEMLIPARLAWGDLDPETTARLVARGIEAPPSALTAAVAPAAAGLDIDAVGTRARRDHAVLRAALGDRLATTTRDDTAQATGETVHHAWVQALIGTDWVDLDPSLPGAQVGQVLTVVTGSGADAPPELRQAVGVRVVAEHLDPITGTLTTTTVLDRSLDAADSLDRIVTLTFKPRSDQLGGTIATLFSGVAEWVPVLGMGDEQREGSGFVAGGSGTDLFGEDVEAPELTALRLELVSSGPDRDPVTATTTLIDRITPAHRAAGTLTKERLLPLPGDAMGAWALGRITHLMISGGGFNARDHLGDLTAGFDFVNDVLLDPERTQPPELADLLRPMMAIDDGLVAGSELVAVPAVGDPERVGAFVAAPRVFVSRIGAADVDGQLMLLYDLVLDDVRIVADPTVPAAEITARRLWYGTLESAIETELVRDRATGDDPASALLRSASYASGDPLEVLDAASAAGRADLPLALIAGLAAGGVAVVPAGVAVPETWWAIGPDGSARALLSPTYGGSYTSGGGRYTGVRQLPRVPVKQGGGAGVWPPPKSPGKSVPVGNTCRGGDSTGYTAILSCVSIPGALVFRLVLATAIDAVIFAVIWGAFKAVEASAGN